MALRFTLRQLEYFVAVGEHGSIARASEAVNVSSPSISAAVRHLEEEFGVELFVRRHAHGLALTEGGRRFYDDAKQLLADAEGLHGLASDIAEHVRGPLSIGCLSTFAGFVLPELRKRFEAGHPSVRVRQIETDQETLIDLLMRSEVDVALTYDLELGQEIEFEPLVALPPCVMLPADHRYAQRAVVHPSQLIDEPMVLLDLPYSREYFLSLFTNIGLTPRVAERTADMSILRSMVANGYGYALANIRPRSGIAPDGKPLRFVRLAGSFRPMVMGIATPRSRHRSKTLSAFAAHCRSLINAGHIPGLLPPDDD